MKRVQKGVPLSPSPSTSSDNIDISIGKQRDKKRDAGGTEAPRVPLPFDLAEP
jgi:hypothetical protein